MSTMSPSSAQYSASKRDQPLDDMDEYLRDFVYHPLVKSDLSLVMLWEFFRIE